MNYNSAGVSHLSSVQQKKSKEAFHLIVFDLIRFLHAMLQMFHLGNVPAGRNSVVSGAICQKQIAVPLHATSSLFQLQIRKESQGGKNMIKAVTHFPLSIIAAFMPFSKHIILSSVTQVERG